MVLVFSRETKVGGINHEGRQYGASTRTERKTEATTGRDDDTAWCIVFQIPDWLDGGLGTMTPYIYQSNSLS